MKKKLNIFLSLILGLSFLLFLFKTIALVNQIKDYISYYNDFISLYPDDVKDVFFSLIISCVIFVIYLSINVFTILSLIYVNRTNLSELLSSTKEKRLAKKEAKRQEKLSELEAKKEELEKTINDLKKE